MTGQDILDLGNSHVGETYQLGVLVPKDNAGWTGPWDCAEFASWLVFQVSAKLYGCVNDVGRPATADAYTGYWIRDAENIGKIITIEQATATPGAALVRASSAEVKIGHIVISDGKGGTVEAHSTATGVINSVVNGRRWDYGVLVPWIDYTQTQPKPVTPPATVIYRYTQPMMVSSKIGEIQQALTDQGFDTFGIDNIFGHDTAQAVEAFQEDNGLVPDGEVGPKTAAALGITL